MATEPRPKFDRRCEHQPAPRLDREPTHQAIRSLGDRAQPVTRLRALVRNDELLGRTQVERVGDRVLRSFQLFARRQASGGLLLLVGAVLALEWANSPWVAAYEQILQVPFGICAGEQLLHLDLRHWVNDGLMAAFFFGVGLEIKREFLVGEFAER